MPAHCRSVIAAALTVAALSTAVTAGAAQAQDRAQTLSGPVKARVAAAITPSTAVLALPGTLEAASDTATVSLAVRYQCRNPKGTTHYLTARLAQDPGASYVLGMRSDTGGLVRATCTGRAVTAVLQLQRSAYSDPAAGLVDGPASLRVDLEARGADGTPGGWYTTTGPGATASGTVAVTVLPSAQPR